MPSPATTPTHRRSRQHFHTVHVRDTLARRAARLFCSIILSFLAVILVILFVVWLALRPHRPRFHVSTFSAHGLAPGSHISFNIADRNPNGNIGIFYEAMACEVFYRDRPVAAAPLLFPFYQPPKNTTMIRAELSGDQLSLGDDTKQQFENDATNGPVKFRLELRSTIRFRLSTLDTHRHRMHVDCLVFVGGDGTILPDSRDKRCSIYFA